MILILKFCLIFYLYFLNDCLTFRISLKEKKNQKVGLMKYFILIFFALVSMPGIFHQT